LIGYLGHEAVACMGRREMLAWRILDENYSFGERRQDMRIAKQTAAILAAMPFRKAGRVRVRDHLLHEIHDEAPEPTLTAARFDAESRGRSNA
jgi:hypothetical protein